jgi:heme/copper-type cytochrome/quinol oxidase subunit 2
MTAARLSTIRGALVFAGALCAVGAALVGESASAVMARSQADEPAVSNEPRRGARLEKTSVAQHQAPTVRTSHVTARRYGFEPARIEVFQDDVVKVELHTEDIAHSLTIDAYRIAKRVGPGQPATFEFRADRTGTFPYYCNLQIDDGCRQMRGELVVKPRP